MGPLQGWGPTFWSPAPKADALNLALYLLFLSSPHCASALSSCREEEFPVGAECCPKCSPGFRVEKACEEFKGTKCVPCTPGTYTAHLNGLEKCLLCRVCDPDMGLVTRRNCTSMANTVCSCAQGHFCVHHDMDDCAECRPHSVCRPGQRVRGTGTELQDTVCEDCLPGTFSPGGTEEVCHPWTRCSGPLEMEVNPGTNSTDVTCSSGRHHLFLGLIPVLVLCLIICAGKMLQRLSVSPGETGQAGGAGTEQRRAGSRAAVGKSVLCPHPREVSEPQALAAGQCPFSPDPEAPPPLSQAQALQEIPSTDLPTSEGVRLSGKVHREKK
ncbi:tumor necrosis factor receptor superfamily member 14 [Rhynchonycteris naso]